jgi:O-antigen ligase
MDLVLRYVSRHAAFLPVVVLCLGTLGRGVMNSLLFLYFIFALSAVFYHVKQNDYRLPKNIGVIGIIWFCLFSGAMLSLSYNDAFDVGIKHWGIALLSSATVFFTLLLPFKTGGLYSNKGLTIIVLLTLAYVGVKLFVCVLDEVCIPAVSVSTMVVPIVASFLLFTFHRFIEKNWFLWFSLFLILITALLVFADSRTEVLMLLMVHLLIAVFYFRKSLLILFVPILFLVVVMFFSLFLQHGEVDPDSDIKDMIYTLSSNRIEIWERSVTNPPPNQLLGVGIDNTAAYLPKKKNRHGSALHNAYLEMWYENGFLWLGLWLGLFIYLLKNIRTVYTQAEGKHRAVYAAFLGSFVAVLTAGMLDKGYLSIYFTFFIFYLGAMLYRLGEPEAFDEFNDENKQRLKKPIT